MWSSESGGWSQDCGLEDTGSGSNSATAERLLQSHESDLPHLSSPQDTVKGVLARGSARLCRREGFPSYAQSSSVW